jgi:cytochrome P450
MSERSDRTISTEPLTDPHAVRAALADDGYTMPRVDPTATTGIAWLRAAVARFSDGPIHTRRRAYAVDLLTGLDPEHLRDRARHRTIAVLAAATGPRERSERHQPGPVEVMSAIARPIPIGVLGAALGVQDDLTPAVATAARSYQPHAGGGPEGDGAVAALVAAFGGAADEPTAARIGLLVQACDATAGLIGNAILAGGVAAALERDPPVRRTRRIHDGREIHLDLTAAPFGAGPHRCPAGEHAASIAAGVLDGLAGWRTVPGGVEYESSPALRIPARILMTSHSVADP